MCLVPQVEVRTKKGDAVPVSLWLRKIETSSAERRCVAVLEPVQRKTVTVSTEATAGERDGCAYSSSGWGHGADSPGGG